MKSLVTGSAGFIGSHLVEMLIKMGHQVVGIDCFTDNYNRAIKKKNMHGFIDSPNFRFIEKDLNDVNLKEEICGVDYIFHQAAQTGVRCSWGGDFHTYVDRNILTTQKLLEAALGSKIRRMVYSSSSSVYGDVETLPMQENLVPKPMSPYGVTKLAGEHLCHLYWKNFGVPTISLRYFTVYGPRQRPDMAFHKFVKAITDENKIEIYGDGTQTRDFTYIDDIVRGNILASQKGDVGEAYNIGGGSRTSVNEAIKLIEDITGKTAVVEYIKKQKGDVRETYADTSKAKNTLGYSPKIGLEEGLQRFVAWYNENMSA